MTYVILILFFGPIILIFLGRLFIASKETVQNVGEEIFRPEKGKYNIQKIDLLTYISEKKTFKIYIQMRLDTTDRYIMLRHLTEDSNDISTYTSAFIFIPKRIDYLLKTEFGGKYHDLQIRDKELHDILKFILTNFNIIQYNDYPKNKTNHYTVITQENGYNNITDDHLNSVFKTVKNFRDIYYDFNLTERHYRPSVLRLLKEHNWDYSRLEIPAKWKYAFDSKKYNSALDWFYQLD